MTHAITPKPTDWIRVGFAMFTVGFGANIFAPMLQVYREEHAASESSLTAMLGIYAAGLIPALLVFGTASDRYGRKPVLLPGVLVSIVGSVVIAFGSLGWDWPLYLGRVIIGVSVGMGMSSGAAWIKQLSVDKPASGPRRATVSVSAGFGLGPLISGSIAEFAPAPEILPYVSHIVLAVVAAALLLTVPETQPRSTVNRPIFPRVIFTGSFFWAVAAWAPWVFGVPTTAFATTPSFVHADVRWTTLFLGFLAFVTMGSGVLIQPTAARLAERGRFSLAAVGLGAAAVGLLVTMLAAVTGWAVLMVVAAVVLGSSYGVMMVAGLAEAERFAGDDDLGSLVGVFYSLTYLGFFVPFVISLVVSGVVGVTGIGTVAAYLWVLAFGVVVCLASIVPVSRAASRG